MLFGTGVAVPRTDPEAAKMSFSLDGMGLLPKASSEEAEAFLLALAWGAADS